MRRCKYLCCTLQICKAGGRVGRGGGARVSNRHRVRGRVSSTGGEVLLLSHDVSQLIVLPFFDLSFPSFLSCDVVLGIFEVDRNIWWRRDRLVTDPEGCFYRSPSDSRPRSRVDFIEVSVSIRKTGTFHLLTVGEQGGGTYGSCGA